jgi:peptide/nickel transport system substrate-binding protein
MNTKRVTRREFLRLTITGAAAAIFAGTSTPAAATTPKYASTLPIEYSEAPMLASLVRTGQLPPIGLRLPTSPLVVPAATVGKYGGT